MSEQYYEILLSSQPSELHLIATYESCPDWYHSIWFKNRKQQYLFAKKLSDNRPKNRWAKILAKIGLYGKQVPSGHGDDTGPR